MIPSDFVSLATSLREYVGHKMASDNAGKT
jgi:hypothetical protein